MTGWSMAENQWGWDGNYFVPLVIRPRPTRNFRPMPGAWDWEKYTDQGWTGAPLEPFRYVVHSFQCDGNLLLGGLLLRCVFPVLAKSWNLTQWGRLLDLVGCGITDVTFDKDRGGNLIDAKNLASTTGRQLWAAMEKAYEIKREFPDGKNAGFLDFLREANGAITEVITGARMTDTGGKASLGMGGVATMQQDALDDLRAGDAERLAETITDQLIIPLVVFNFGPQKNYPYAVIYHDNPADLTNEIKVDDGLHTIGLPLSKNDLYERYGRTAPAADAPDDVLAGAPPKAVDPTAPVPMSMRKFSADGGEPTPGDTTAPSEIIASDDALQSQAISAIENADTLHRAIVGLRELAQHGARQHTERMAYEIYRTQALGHFAGIWQDMALHHELPADAAHSTGGLALLNPARLWTMNAANGGSAQAFATVIDQWANVPFQEAIDYFKRKGIVSAEEWDALAENYRHRAFYAAQLGTANEMSVAYDEVLRGIEEGRSTQEVVQTLRQRLQGPVGQPSYSRSYLRSLFDQNVANAYAYGRTQRQERTRDVRPYGRYVTMGDSRVRPAHAAINGTILPLDDPWWSINNPGLAYACRCTRTTLDQDTIDRRGWKINEESPPNVADPGFDVPAAQKASADERMTALRAETQNPNSLLNGYQIPANVIESTAGGRPVLVGETR